VFDYNKDDVSQAELGRAKYELKNNQLQDKLFIAAVLHNNIFSF
jgi:hypothetical protein